jgi:hypothetical protein
MYGSAKKGKKKQQLNMEKQCEIQSKVPTIFLKYK